MPKSGSAKQDLFVAEYLVDLNATAAAIRAGYSAKSAEVQAHQLLKKPSVQNAVQKAKQAQLARVGVNADTVLRELLWMATCDIGEAFDENGNLKALKDIPAGVRRAMSGIEIEERRDGSGDDAEIYQVKKVKFWPKDRALEALGRHLKLFTDKVEISGKLTLEELVRAARKRITQ